MKLLNQSVLFFAIMSLFGCESEPPSALQDSLANSSVDQASIQATLAINATSTAVGDGTTQHLYNPGAGVAPTAIDLLFKDSTDGTLNIPIVSGDPKTPLYTVMNAMDGFSTGAPISTSFSAAINSATIPVGIRMFEVGLSGFGRAVVSIKDELTFGDDFVASLDATGTTLVILPYKRPLKPDTSYYVVITNSLLDTNGDSVKPSSVYSLAKDSTTTYVDSLGASLLENTSDADAATMEALRQLVTASEFTVDYAYEDLSAINIIASWSFTTQSVGKVLAQVRSNLRAGAVPDSMLVDSTSDSPQSAADIYIGTLDIPYYLTAASGVNDTTPLASFWTGVGGSLLSRVNPNPVATSTESIPLMVSVPKSTAPANGYPVVIYQHGITTNRATMLAIADSMAAAGLAVVAIDMPMHGLTGNETNGTENFYKNGALNTTERTFDLDLVNNSTSAPDPDGDGTTDTSGKHFINMENLLNTRDNVRQSVSDLFTLTYALEGMTAGTASFDTSRIYFIGHSLGAMVGTPFLALEPNVRDAALVFGGGSLPKILDGSASFGPTIAAGLGAKGVVKGTSDYESFLAVAQTAVDSGDPINYADAAVAGRGLLFFEIAGGNSSPSDLVVPNTVPDGNDSSGTVPAPLAGTEPLLTLMGLTQVNSDQQGSDLQHSIKFVVGNHGSLLDPSADAYNDASTNLAVTTEIQTIIATFLASDGMQVNVNEATVDTLLQAP